MRRALALAATAVLAAPAALPACGTQPPKNPSYLLVTLDVPPGLAATPHAVQVKMTSTAKGVSPATFCVQLEPPGAGAPASFVLERAYGADSTATVTLTVTPFAALQGGSEGNQGQDFPCPSKLPPPIGAPQEVTVDFCAAKANKIVFHPGALCCPASDGGTPAPDGGDDGGDDGGNDGGDDGGNGGSAGSGGGSGVGGAAPDAGAGSTCGCAAKEVCGAGLGTDGYACAPDACCAQHISSACALEPTP